MILRSESVVLKTIPYGETSLIAALFTRAKGRVSVIAKGARVPGSRFGSSLQPLTHGEVVFYYKSGRGVHTLSDSAIVEPLFRIHRDVRRMGTGMRIIELVAALLHEEEENPLLFNLLLQVLHYLNEPQRSPENLLAYFQLRMAGALGFAPRVHRAAVEAVGERGAHISLATGEVLATPQAASRHASRSAIRAFAIFARADVEAVIRLELDASVRAEVERLIEEFMRYHVEDAYPTRSARVLGQLHDVEERAKKDDRRRQT